jgi:SAM-dependent methyltransferase
MPVLTTAKRSARRLLATKLYPRPISELHPGGLYAYLDALYQRRELEGAIVEVGCWLGGTAALAKRMMTRAGMRQPYVCIDTFGGFVPSQLAAEPAGSTGTTESFASNSIDIVARLLRHWDAGDVRLVPGDIATLPDAAIPDQIAVALIDVDLKVPVYEGLRRIVPRLVPGGIVLVDDCADPDWPGARAGYEQFATAPEYFLGMGIVRV